MSDVEKETKVVLTPSLLAVGYEIAEHARDGWEIDENLPLGMNGFQYEVGFIRNFDASRPAPKPTAAERMAKARAARGAKKVAEE